MYKGSYKQKKIVKLAPDAIVHVNKKQDIEICPKCHSKIILSNYLTSVTTHLANNATVGTATFTISFPKHGHKGDYFVRDGRVYGINLMDEIEIFFKGRFPGSNGVFLYYRN